MKEWIWSVLFRHWISGALLLTLTASYSWYIFFQIKWKATTRQAVEYTHLYSPDCPAMLLTNDGITFDPPIYQFVSNENQLTLVFDPSDTTETLPDSASRGSLLFTPSRLTYRGRKKDHLVPLRDGNISTDSLNISPQQLRDFVPEKFSFIGQMTFLIGWLLMVIAVLFLGFITTAIFMGFDLLTRERLQWSSGYNLASTILFILWLFWYIQNLFNWHIPGLAGVLLLLYLLLSWIGLTLTYNFIAKPGLLRNKKG